MPDPLPARSEAVGEEGEVNLFGDADESTPEQVRRGLEILENASKWGVPYPYDEEKDRRTLMNISAGYPGVNVVELLEKFLVWTMEEEPWKHEKTIRWRSRLVTWARNDERFGKQRHAGTGAGGTRIGRTHHAAPGGRDSEATEVVDKW
jgi:hypothetical protein